MKEKTQNAGRGASLAMGVAFVGFTTQFGLIPLVRRVILISVMQR